MKSFALLALAALPIALATDNRRHFYTTNPAGEMAKQGGYTNGGVTAYAFISQADGTVPMYRCYNGPQDLHFYTTDSNCEGAANYHVETTGWYCYPNQGQEQGQGDLGYYNFEGTACYVYSQQANGASPIYGWYRGTDY